MVYGTGFGGPARQRGPEGRGEAAGVKRFLLLLFWLLAAARAENLFDSTTHALVIGVLEFEHSDLYHSFGKADRRDAELAQLLKAQGADVTFLSDGQATLANIKKSFVRVAGACGPDDQLIVYYAGHGGKSANGRDVLFAPYDGGDEDSSNLSAAWMLRTLRSDFNGDRVLFVVDCCSSGGLADQLEDNPGELQAAALTSSSANETSTGTWTFTQDFLDALRGKPIMDKNHDGSVSLNELGRYVRADMSDYFGQMTSYVTTNKFPGGVELGAVPRKALPGEGERIQAVFRDGKWYPARVVTREGTRTKVRWMDIGWDTARSDEWKEADKVRPLPKAPAYAVGARVEVEWTRKWWPAEVIKVQDGIHRIHYVGYGPEWDEWVPPKRIRKG